MQADALNQWEVVLSQGIRMRRNRVRILVKKPKISIGY